MKTPMMIFGEMTPHFNFVMNKSKTPLVSVIVIDYKRDNPYLIECLNAIEKQTYKNFEIILESDHPVELHYPHLRIIHYSGKYRAPAFKRDHGAKIAQGTIVAFIDDDASPDPQWLEKMAPLFEDKSVVGVGGPGVTPLGVGWQEAASGWASASPIGAGPYTYRFLPGKKQFVDDYPSMNLAVRRKDFLSVGGYDSNYWPGEDTKLCLDLTFKLKKKIIYHPEVLVYHHRRPIWSPHLKQNGNFGLHRGFFARILPETSLRPIYFGPSIMFLGLLYLMITSFFPLPPIFLSVRHLGICLLGFYLIILLVNSLWVLKQSKSLLQSCLSIPVIFVTHLWYGIRFIQGYIFTGKLKR